MYWFYFIFLNILAKLAEKKYGSFDCYSFVVTHENSTGNGRSTGNED